MMPPWTYISTEAAHKPSSSVRPVEVATAIVLVLLAVVLRWAPSRAGSRSTSQETAISPTGWASAVRRPTLRQFLGAVFAGLAVGLFIGGPAGVFCGLLSTAGALAFASRRVSETETRDRLRLVAAAPPVVDLFAAGLAAGLLPADAAAVAATAFNVTKHHTSNTGDVDETDAEHSASRKGRFARLRPSRLTSRRTRAVEPTNEIAERFAAAARALHRGADPETAWRPLAVDGATAPVAAAALRASRTGAPASETVAKAARDLWSVAEQAAQAQIRSAAVRAAVPLALCFLPAFVLLGIVPTTLGLLAELWP